MDDAAIAGFAVTIVTGLVRKIIKLGEAGTVVALAIITGIIALLWWGSDLWPYAALAYDAVKAVVASVAIAIGTYEAGRRKDPATT